MPVKTGTLAAYMVALWLAFISGPPAFGQAGTAFTYQGQLSEGPSPANGVFTMSFRLYNALTGGTRVGPEVSPAAVLVEDGRFDVRLDFGVQPTGTRALWLEIEVEGFVLSPRQPITGTPFSIQTRGIYVDADGDVGIGTEAPDADLHVAGPAASLALRSSSGPATLSLRGPTPGGFGGTYSTISFENGTGAERFALSLGNVFGQDAILLRPFDDPTDVIQLREDGKAAVGDTPSIARVHVTDRDIGVYNDAMLNETLALEDNDAVLGLYSSSSGSFGSAITLGEIVNNTLTDKWSLVRTTTTAGSELRVTYGSNPNYAQNPAALTFTPQGLRFPGGSVQRWAPVADADTISTYVSIPTDPQVYSDPAIVTIDAAGQRVLLTAFVHVQTLASDVDYQLVYRRRDTGFEPWIPLLPQRKTGRAPDRIQFRLQTGGQTTIVNNLAPGTYEFAVRLFSSAIIDDGQVFVARFQGVDITAIVF